MYKARGEVGGVGGTEGLISPSKKENVVLNSLSALLRVLPFYYFRLCFVDYLDFLLQMVSFRSPLCILGVLQSLRSRWEA